MLWSCCLGNKELFSIILQCWLLILRKVYHWFLHITPSTFSFLILNLLSLFSMDSPGFSVARVGLSCFHKCVQAGQEWTCGTVGTLMQQSVSILKTLSSNFLKTLCGPNKTNPQKNPVLGWPHCTPCLFTLPQLQSSVLQSLVPGPPAQGASWLLGLHYVALLFSTAVRLRPPASHSVAWAL